MGQEPVSSKKKKIKNIEKNDQKKMGKISLD